MICVGLLRERLKKQTNAYVKLYVPVKVAARAATFTVLTPHNVAPQNRNQPHPTLPVKTYMQ